MGKMILVTGGCRSGKSSYAERTAENLGARKLYLATAPVLDPEMEARVAEHRRRRAGCGWETVEEQLDLERVLREQTNEYAVVLIDCLTLWVNNLMYREELRGRVPAEDEVAAEAEAFLRASRACPATVIFVTNEVGWGIVPDNPAARLFRDLAGRCNQTVAAAADEVVLVVCGQPVFVKKPLA